jgi:amino acid transporter
MMTPWLELKTMAFPAADALRTVSPIVGTIVLVGALFGLITTFNGFFCSASRLLFAMGRCRILPAWFSVIHPVYRTPINAIKFITSLRYWAH